MFDRRFEIIDTPIEGLKVVQRLCIGDERGFLSRLYCSSTFAQAGFLDPVVQINQTLTKRLGTVRGMHFQYPPHAEDKFVSVLQGEVFDVAVDLRQGSSTFLQWHGERLSGEGGRSLFIPKGFAHGFQTLTMNCELLYLHTAAYRASAEGGIWPLDRVLGIDWPLEITEMSTRDQGHARLSTGFTGVF